MIEASIKNKVKLLCGHTQSFGPHIRTMRKIIRSGELGRLCALHVWAYTDWMLRPRTAEELDINQGGGVPYRQGPHQIDTLATARRRPGAQRARSTGQWFKGRPIPGYYSGFMEFEDGTPATLMHNGYGYFLASELVPWGGQNSRYSEAERAAIRKVAAWTARATKTPTKTPCASAARNEERSSRPQQSQAVAAQRSRHPCRDLRERRYPPVAIRPVRSQRRRHQRCSAHRRRWTSRRGELMELYNAVVLDKPIRHTGPWGMATLEVCLALMQSAKERKGNLS